MRSSRLGWSYETFKAFSAHFLPGTQMLILFSCLCQAAAAYPQLQQAVARMCLAWWQSGARNRESLVTQTIPYYLVAALSTGAGSVHSCLSNPVFSVAPTPAWDFAFASLFPVPRPVFGMSKRAEAAACEGLKLKPFWYLSDFQAAHDSSSWTLG